MSLNIFIAKYTSHICASFSLTPDHSLVRIFSTYFELVRFLLAAVPSYFQFLPRVCFEWSVGCHSSFFFLVSGQGGLGRGGGQQGIWGWWTVPERFLELKWGRLGIYSHHFSRQYWTRRVYSFLKQWKWYKLVQNKRKDDLILNTMQLGCNKKKTLIKNNNTYN